MHFLSHENLTVHNDSRVAQFSMYNEKRGPANCYVTPMTEDNCASFEWLDIAEENPTLETRLAALMRLITVILMLLVKIMNNEVVFGGDK